MIPVPLPTLDYGEQLRRQDAAVRQFAVAASYFLGAAFPHVERSVIGKLGDAFIDWLCCGTNEQLKAIDEQKAMRAMRPKYPGFDTNDANMLVYLIEERDRLMEQIELAEKAKEEFPVEGLANMVEATMVMPLRQRLESLDKQISSVQKQLEEVQSANEPQSQISKGDEGSANEKG